MHTPSLRAGSLSAELLPIVHPPRHCWPLVAAKRGFAYSVSAIGPAYVVDEHCHGATAQYNLLLYCVSGFSGLFCGCYSAGLSIPVFCVRDQSSCCISSAASRAQDQGKNQHAKIVFYFVIRGRHMVNTPGFECIIQL